MEKLKKCRYCKYLNLENWDIECMHKNSQEFLDSIELDNVCKMDTFELNEELKEILGGNKND
jgi:hypothetical protein